MLFFDDEKQQKLITSALHMHYGTFLIIDSSTMGNGNTKDDKAVVFDDTNGAVVPDSIAPLACPIRTKRFTMGTRVGGSVDVLLEPL